jgi:hypothetical protein
MPTPTSLPTSTATSKPGLSSRGKTIGIAVGATLAGLIIILLALLFLLKKVKDRRKAHDRPDTVELPEQNVKTEVSGKPVIYQYQKLSGSPTELESGDQHQRVSVTPSELDSGGHTARLAELP